MGEEEEDGGGYMLNLVTGEEFRPRGDGAVNRVACPGGDQGKRTHFNRWYYRSTYYILTTYANSDCDWVQIAPLTVRVTICTLQGKRECIAG